MMLSTTNCKVNQARYFILAAECKGFISYNNLMNSEKLLCKCAEI